jgi:RimJ/RimL family protein N-acetyltransferase
MPYVLLPLLTPTLEWLADSRIPAELAGRTEPESLPPAFVAARALKLEANPDHPNLPTSYLIVRDQDSRVVGACGFKTPLGLNRVAVGYGVAPSTRGQGAASAALKLLTELALQSGTSEVLAEIVPTNAASIRVAQNAGFIQVGARVDEDNEYVTQWLYRSGA